MPHCCCLEGLVRISHVSSKGEGKERQVARAFDGGGQLALVLGAGARLAAWANFAIFGHKAAQHVALLIINTGIFVGAELADLWPGGITPVTTRLLVLIDIIVTHILLHLEWILIFCLLIVFRKSGFGRLAGAGFTTVAKDHHFIGHNFNTGVLGAFAVFPAAGL